MTTTFTTRLGLSLIPNADPLTPMRENFLKIDKTAGHIWVADNVTPADADLFDGAIVHEITSDKVWVARTNGVGGYTKKWLEYPWAASAFSTSVNVGNNAWAEYTFATWGGGSVAGGGPVNADASALSAGRIVVPIKGIYSVDLAVQWFQSSSGSRGACVNFNGAAAAEDVNTTSLIPNAGISAHTTHRAQCRELLPAGTAISANLWQNSGATNAVTFAAFVTLIRPVP